MGTVIGYVIIGLLSGVIVEALQPRRRGSGWPVAVLLSVTRALIGGFLGGLVLDTGYQRMFSARGLVTAIMGSLGVLIIDSLIRRRSTG